MERVAGGGDVSHLGIGDLDAFGIILFVQLGAHLEVCICCRRGDQLDDRAIATQWLSPPVDGDEGEETMLDLVPFAGAEIANTAKPLRQSGAPLRLTSPLAS